MFERRLGWWRGVLASLLHMSLAAHASDFLLPGNSTFPPLVVLGKPHNYTQAVRACASVPQLGDGIITVLAPMAHIFHDMLALAYINLSEEDEFSAQLDTVR